MATYQPEPGTTLTIPRRTLRVTAWDTERREPQRVDADIEDGPPDPTARRPHLGLLLLPDVTRGTVVRVRPPGDAAFFPAAARIGLRLETEPRPGAEPVEVVVENVDVAGLRACEVLVLRPQGDLVAVEVVDAVGEDPMEGLAARVRSRAWAALRVEERGHPDRRRTTLLVDRSGSMRPAAEDGSLAALVEAVAGLASVVGRRDPVRVGLTGRLVTWLPPVRGPELARSVVAALAERGHGCGFRPSAVELDSPDAYRREPGTEPGAVFVVTDTTPSDVATLADQTRRDGRLRQVLVAGPDHAGRATSALPHTVLAPPPPGLRATEHLLGPGSHGALDAFLDSLLAPWAALADPLTASEGTP